MTTRATRSRSRPGGAPVTDSGLPFASRKPSWLRVQAPGGTGFRAIERDMRESGLQTVCEEANCPNIGECWESGTATFMILGDTCTRRCGFCNVRSGSPAGPPDDGEPRRVAAAAAQMKLDHCVVTSVDRDDLPDGGAAHFAATVEAIRRAAPRCRIEVLTPDFRGEEMPLARVVGSAPDVFNHNVETVPRLYARARRGSSFERSCRVLWQAKEMAPRMLTKSGMMVGLGETVDEMVDAFRALLANRVDMLTVGQYLRPTRDHLPVSRYWRPEEFAALRRAALDLGFRSVAAGPLVRSSYRAARQVADSGQRELGAHGVA